jgi:hypothetical protein
LWDGQPLILFQITLHHNLPYCKLKVQQIIKQSNKKRIYNLFTLLESRNAATNFVTGLVSIENDMIK